MAVSGVDVNAAGSSVSIGFNIGRIPNGAIVEEVRTPFHDSEYLVFNTRQTILLRSVRLQRQSTVSLVQELPTH